MKRFYLLLTSLLIALSVSAQETVTLTVNGQGITKEEATANALRSAIEQSFGTFVSANTQILNDEIATVASGNIKKYKELGCVTLPDGRKSVSLSATVSIGNLISYAKSIVRTSSGGHIDISSLSSFFYPIEQFYGNLITEEVAYYDERTEQWGDFKDCKANISIDPQASTIKLSGVHDETYKIIFYPDKWTKGDVSQSIILDCISSVGESVRIRFEKPTGATRQLIFYHSNGMTMCFNISSEGRSILKSNYEIHPAGGVNYMFYNNPAKFRQYEDDGTTYELPYSGIVKCSGEMPICITGVFGNFYWENPKYTDNLVIVEKDGKWGAIDFVDTSNPNGIYGIPFIYDKMEPFDGGKSDAVLNGNRVVVLATDKVFMPFTDFIDNKNPIDIIGETILLDGHHIIPGDAGSYIGFEYKNKIGFSQNASDAIILFCPQYDKVYLEDKYMILVSKDGKWGAIPKWYVEQCDEIPCIYDKMSPFNNGISEVVLNGERFTINMKGEKIQ